MNTEYITQEIDHQEQRNLSLRFYRRLAVASLSGILLVGCDTIPLEEPAQTPSVSEQSNTVSETNEIIPPSRVTDLLIVNEAGDKVLATDVHPLDKCMPVIDPPREGEAASATYQCMDYAMPGSKQKGLAILTGHSSVNIKTDFNSLYTQGNRLVGDMVRVKTAKSDGKWLKYTVQSVLTPDKHNLPYMPEVWGAPGEDVDGRLVLVTCLQNTDGSDSTNNFIVVAEQTN